jgi:uncharacterized protein (DUF1330 family)
VTAYVIFDVEIRNANRYQAYMDLVKPLVLAAGGRYLARGKSHTVYEGDWEPRRLVLFEFPSVAAFEAFYSSSPYRKLKAIRDECSSVRLVAVEGLEPGESG